MPNPTPSPTHIKQEIRTMPWKCIDCRASFQGPTDRTPEGGCPFCHSRNVIDINVTPVSEAEANETFKALKGFVQLAGGQLS